MGNNDTDEWARVLVKRSTYDRIKVESLETGMKMYAVIDRYIPGNC